MRFISEDTNKGDVKDPLSLNLYTYCQGNPIRLVDIDGHSPRIAGPSLDMSFSEFMSSVLSIIPVIGDAKDFHEALTGIDTITGEEISKSGRWITLACALVPFVPGKTGRELIGGAGKALTGFDDVSNYISKNGKLPGNFITKSEATKLGWDPKAGNLAEIAPGKSIGGDIFKNKGNPLPTAPGRIWYEADVNYTSGFRGTDRILYSNDGLIYKSTDHYKTFTKIR